MPQLDGEHRFWEAVAPIMADDERIVNVVHWMLANDTVRESDVEELAEVVDEVAEGFGVPFEHRECMNVVLNICEANFKGVA